MLIRPGCGSHHLILCYNHSLQMRQMLVFLCRWTKPGRHTPIPNAALDLARSKLGLMLENVLLRQQLIVLRRQTKRPASNWRDRALFVLRAKSVRESR